MPASGVMPDPTDPTDASTMTRDCSERRFRIWVEGRLSGGFADGLAGVDQHDEPGGTVLDGDYVDESHLRSVLDRLGDLGIRIRRFDVDEAHTGTDSAR